MGWPVRPSWKSVRPFAPFAYKLPYYLASPKQLLSIGGEFLCRKHAPHVKTLLHSGLLRRTTPTYHPNIILLNSCTECPILHIAQSTTAALCRKIKCLINIKVIRWGTLLLESVTTHIDPAHNILPMVTLLSHIRSVHTPTYCVPNIHSTQSSQRSLQYSLSTSIRGLSLNSTLWFV